MSSNQFNGLLIKNFNLLTKQTGTIICQVITPVLCLGFVFLIQVIVEANIGKSAYGVKFDYPIFFNLPIYDNLVYSRLPIKTTTCDEWYLYEFAEDTPEEDKKFFGENDGMPSKFVKQRSNQLNKKDKEEEIYPFYNYSHYSNKPENIWEMDDEDNFTWMPESFYDNEYISGQTKNDFDYYAGYNSDVASSGMLSAGTNLMQRYCLQSEKLTPFFVKAERGRKINIDDPESSSDKPYPDDSKTKEKTSSSNTNDNDKTKKIEFDTAINDEIFARLKALNEVNFTKIRRGFGINVLPDGAVKIYRANKKELSYTLMVNDNQFPFYHKANGVTMLKIYNAEAEKYNSLLNVMSGALWVADLINRAYMKMFNPNLYVISGIQPMPFELDTSSNVQRIINLAGSTFYPLAISLLMPLFMYTIVLEKESRLVEIMKINGLKMKYYWLSLFTYNFIIYSVTFIIFYIIGRFAFGFKLFTDTSGVILLIIFFGWGFCQIGLAYFFQSFLSNARTSTSKLKMLLFIF